MPKTKRTNKSIRARDQDKRRNQRKPAVREPRCFFRPLEHPWNRTYQLVGIVSPSMPIYIDVDMAIDDRNVHSSLKGALSRWKGCTRKEAAVFYGTRNTWTESRPVSNRDTETLIGKRQASYNSTISSDTQDPSDNNRPSAGPPGRGTKIAAETVSCHIILSCDMNLNIPEERGR